MSLEPVKSESFKGQSGCFQGHAQIAVVAVQNLEEARVGERRFVDSECFHDPQRSRALERARERTIPVEETWGRCPFFHLGGVEKKTTGMGIRPALEGERLGKEIGAELAAVVHILPAGGEIGLHRSVDVELVNRPRGRGLKAVRLEKRVVSEGPTKPTQLAEKRRVVEDEVVLEQ
jgi:hypothetical protein